MYDSNYPPMMRSEYENAPWNEEEEKLDIVDAIVGHSFDFVVPVEVPENLDDNFVLTEYYNHQYPSLEDVFKYLREYFSHPNDAMQTYIKLITQNAVVTDTFVDFNY